MRVGLHRLCSALDLVAPLIACPAGLAAEISWIKGQVAPARDWEVHANTTLPAVLRYAPADLLTDPLRGAAAMAKTLQNKTTYLAVRLERVEGKGGERSNRGRVRNSACEAVKGPWLNRRKCGPLISARSVYPLTLRIQPTNFGTKLINCET